MSAPLTHLPSGTQLLPRLYAHAAGPLSAAYYRAHFERMEAQGQALGTWNHAAAFNTFAWLCLRRMWWPALIYAVVAALLLVVWWGVLWPALSPTAAGLAGVVIAIALVVVPGWWGNHVYYLHLRARTLQTLQVCDTMAQAEQQLGMLAVTAQRRNTAAALQAALLVGLAGAALSFLPAAPPPSPSAEAAPSGPPVLHFPEAATAPAAPTLPAPELAASEPSVPVAFAAIPPAPSAAAVSATPTPTPSQAQLPNAAKAPAVPSPAPAPTPAMPAPARAATTPASASALQLGRFYLNVGVFSQVRNADNAEQSLRQAGLPVLRTTLTTSKGEVVRVRSGPFESAAQAQSAQRAAAQHQLQATVFQHRASN